ncbi:alpha/beta hydrolase family protein [Rhizorhabdus dicambivorans]|uniref:alpha/beta hydrolase family protein n=1 Tax=Rhizorhabdus dicambivorans TaxID=1850238 RepID=UPI001864239C|nr:prolyl oligopeptidase family serine peptidase [Rhizorhabdus dicambivorans]
MEGAVRRTAEAACAQPWEPRIDRGYDDAAWRRLLIYSLDTESWEPAINGPVTVWEADWCGDHAIAAIVSDDQGEGAWFDARLELFALGASGGLRPSGTLDQLGWVRGSADGKWIAIVDAVCSDRWVVAGDLILIEAGSNSVHRIDCGFDVTHVEWRGADHLLVAGVDGLESVAAMVTPSSRQTSELWRSQATSVAGHSVKIAGRGDSGDFVLAGEGFAQAPEIALVSQGLYRCLFCLYADQPGVLPAFDVRAMEWRAGDGLNIEGWLLTPAAPPPWPLVVQVHGGPVAHWRPAWLGRRIPSALLLSRGFAVLLANPRGSSGRGRAFAGAVRGDMGGADAEDLVSGVEELIAAGLVDPARIGITGVSYGGFMTAWLLTQSRRFAAGVSVAPIINHQTHRLLSNISRFSELFVGAPEQFPDGPWRERSPLFFARQVQVPTLTICGALDRCTPPIEAEQFHAALRCAGAVSELVTYPLEGHGIRGFPAVIDYAARLVAWFVAHMPAQSFAYSGHSRR